MTTITRLIPSLDAPLALVERRLKRELRLVERARADGAVNRPGPGETELTETELAVITRLQEAIDQASQWLARRLRAIAKIVADLAPTAEERDLEGPVADARFEIASLRDERRDALTAAFADMRRRGRELRAFQREHRLTHRSAAYAPKIVAIGLALAVLAAETALNTPFFADASGLGLLGGWATALGVSLVNLFLGYVVIGAIGLRFCGHVRWTKRLGGGLAVVVGAAAALAFNAYVAAWRGLLALDPDAVGLRILDRMLAEPTAFLNDDQGAMLFALGLGAALLFAVEGYLLSADRYPGYRSIDLAHRRAEAAWEAEKTAFRTDAAGIADARAALIGARLAAAEGKLRAAVDRINQADVDLQTAQQSAIESRNVAQRLVATYRAENAAVRDAPAPGYFRVLPDFDAGLRGLPAVDLAAQRAARIEEGARLRAAAAAAREALRAMALEALEQIKADADAAAREGARRADGDGDDDDAVVVLPRRSVR